MKKVKIVVVEDELIFAEELVDFLKETGYEVFGPAISYTEGLQLIKEVQPDLLLTDIQLSGSKTGIDLVETVRKETNLAVIFLTSFSDKETIQKARLNRPDAFLVKPYNQGELYAAIEIAIDKVEKDSNESFIYVKAKDCYEKLDLKEIIYAQSDHVYIDLFTATKKYVIRQSLNEFIEKNQGYFIRVHRSFCVNKNQIKGYTSDKIIVGDFHVPVGKNFLAAVQTFIKK